MQEVLHKKCYINTHLIIVVIIVVENCNKKYYQVCGSKN